MSIVGMPAAEVPIDSDLVAALLRSQHPDLAEMPLTFLSEGWDNVMFRLGEGLVVRLPRRQLSVVLVEHEQRWLPELVARLPLPIPSPVRVGVAGGGYPWPWSVVPWVAGERAADAVFRDPGEEAERLGQFLAALHQPASPDAPKNAHRGVPLADRDSETRKRLAQLEAVVDTAALADVWEDGLDASTWSGPPLWIHGDLHAANIVVDGGRIVSVIDWGDITAGDPATDLAVAWMLFDADERSLFRRAAGAVDDATWRRARAWGATMGLAYVAHSADNPAMGAIGRRLLGEVVG